MTPTVSSGGEAPSLALPRGQASGDGAGGARSLRRRRSLPGSRAVVGGLLVTLAAVGIFAAYTDVTADGRQSYLVAARPLRQGATITAGDLRTASMRLPGQLAHDRVFRDPDRLVGATVVGPVDVGELIQASDVLVGEPGPARARVVSFAVDPARAVDGRLRAGEAVDVLATYGTGPDAYTVEVLRGVTVVDRSAPSGGMNSTDREVLTVTLASQSDALAVAHATTAGAVTVVRANGTGPTGPAPSAGSTAPAGPGRDTGTGRAGKDAPTAYRPPPPSPTSRPGTGDDDRGGSAG